jgi:hypothetical protein
MKCWHDGTERQLTLMEAESMKATRVIMNIRICGPNPMFRDRSMVRFGFTLTKGQYYE